MAELFDLPNIMRKRNIFGVSEDEAIPANLQIANEPAEPRAIDKFMESINAMPQRENYKPSKWRKAGAGLVGAFQGAGEGAAFREAPFTNALGDWKLKNDALASASSHERMADSAASQDEYRRMTDSWRRDVEANNKIETDRRLGIAEQNAATAQQRADTYAELNRGGTVREDKVTGKTYLITRVGEVKELPINALTEEDRQRLATEGRLEVVEAQGQNAVKVAGINQAGADRRNAATIAGANARNAATNATRLATDNTAAGGISETQRKQGMINRAGEYIRANPQAEEWITIDDNGLVQITPPDKWFRDKSGDNAKIEEIRKYIDPDYKGPMGSVAVPPTKSTTPVPKSNTSSMAATAAKRQAAVDALKAAKAPITEANILAAMKQLEGK